MFRSFSARQLLFASLLGLILPPAVSWATTTTIPAPFDTFGGYNPTTQTYSSTYGGAFTGTLPSLSSTDPMIPFSNANFGPSAPQNQYQTQAAVNTAKLTATGREAYYEAVAGGAGTNTYVGFGNLSNNDLIVVPPFQTQTSAVATYKAINDMVRSSIFGGQSQLWTGPGIGSATAGNDPQFALGVGVLLNNFSGADFSTGGIPYYSFQGDPSGYFQTGFDGYQGLTPYDTIIKYTFVGDTFLRGLIDSTDTGDVFAALGTTPTINYWNNGDLFYYAGTAPIDSSDTGAVFANNTLQSRYPYTFAESSSSLGGASSLGGNTIAVPEPSSFLLIGLGIVVSVLAVRRRGAMNVERD